MTGNSKFIVRRTLSQERFEALWEKRTEGEITLKELTEMDEIINRDPLVRQFVLKEMEDMPIPSQNNGQNTPPPPPVSTLQKLAGKVGSFFKGWATLFTATTELAMN